MDPQSVTTRGRVRLQYMCRVLFSMPEPDSSAARPLNRLCSLCSVIALQQILERLYFPCSGLT